MDARASAAYRLGVAVQHLQRMISILDRNLLALSLYKDERIEVQRARDFLTAETKRR